MKGSVIATAAIVVALAAYAWPRQTSKPSSAAPRWEYQKFSLAVEPNIPEDSTKEQVADIMKAYDKLDKQYDADLKRAGEEGWELVAVVPGKMRIGIGEMTFHFGYFKRPAR